MDCKHIYFQIVDGKLLCVICGQPPSAKPAIEDKIGERPEVKLNVPVERRHYKKHNKRR